MSTYKPYLAHFWAEVHFRARKKQGGGVIWHSNAPDEKKYNIPLTKNFVKCLHMIDNSRKTPNKQPFLVLRCVADKFWLTIWPHGTYASLCTGPNLYIRHNLLWCTTLNHVKGHKLPLTLKRRLCRLFFDPEITTLITKILTCG